MGRAAPTSCQGQRVSVRTTRTPRSRLPYLALAAVLAGVLVALVLFAPPASAAGTGGVIGTATNDGHHELAAATAGCGGRTSTVRWSANAASP
jgi:hypothetical protein